MKKLIFIVFAIVLMVAMLAIGGCKRERNPEVRTVGVSDITSLSAKLSATIVDDGNGRIASMGFYYSTDQGMSNKQTALYNGYNSVESFSVYVSDLQPSTTYYFQAFAMNGKGTGIGEVMSFTTLVATSGSSGGSSQGGDTPTPTPTPGQLNGHTYVDLGLLSGTLWATCNVGAENPEEYGDYFAWGETSPKEIYNWSTYRWCNGSQYSLTKYCDDANFGNNGFTDTLTTLEPSDDVATICWGSEWRMPGSAQLRELWYNCTKEWTTYNGIEGCLFTGPNGNNIFLPAAGCRYNNEPRCRGFQGWYRARDLETSFPVCAKYFLFESGNYSEGGFDRSGGLTVRPICSNTPIVTLFTVHFNANNGLGEMQSQIFRQGVSQALHPNDFTRDGYIFSGWNTSPNGAGTSYCDGQVITVNSNITLYAQWTANGSSQGDGQLNGHSWVDLGLPSGIKWATCNVGASNPEDYGNYYAWGETATKEYYSWWYSWSTYRWCDGNDEGDLTKYCSNADYGNNGFTDNLTTLEASDDAATANWGSGWRMPTQTEMNELLSNCTHVWTTWNGVSGCLLTGVNGNSIFLPAAGYRTDIYLYNDGFNCHYWSSSLYVVRSVYAWGLYFYSGDFGVDDASRNLGFSVRPICR